MPRIPTQDGSRVRVPVAESGGALPINPSSPGSTLGAGLGQAADQIGAVEAAEAQAQARYQAAQEAVERARDEGVFSETLANELRRLQTEDDLSKPEVLRAFGQLVREKELEVTSQHRGSPLSQERLKASIETQKIRLLGTAATEAGKARQALIKRSMDGRLGAHTAEAFDAPASLASLWSSWDRVVDDMAPALGPAETEKYRTLGRQETTASAIQSLIDNQAYDEVDRVVRDVPGVAQALKPETLRAFQSAVLVGRNKMEREKKQNMFGGGAEGLALQIITEDSASFKAGLLSPDQERRFMAAVTHYTQPTQYLDPDTGRMVTRTPNLPPFVADALRSKGAAQPARPQSAPQSTGAPSPTARTPQPTAQPTPQSTGQSTGQPRSNPQVGSESETIWNMATLATGPAASIGVLAGKTPVVGDIVGAPQMTTARTTLDNLARDLVNVLRNNPRFSEGERQALEKEIEIRPQFWDRPESLRQRLIGVDNALSQRQKNAAKILSGDVRTTLEERQHAQESLNAITAFREKLGLPVRVKTRDEALKLPSGTEFITPNGEVRVRP